ncbi:MAG: S16 family serine protease, partial [Candidatus Spyradocola sp.]
GQWRATGIIEQEQLESGARRMTRRSTAAGAVENVRTALRGYGLDVDAYDVHIDFPGGMPVDGPSAGVAMAVAVYSAITGKPVDGCAALTGEIGIGGEVLPVGGVPAKIEAALRAGATTVLIPRENYERAFARESAVHAIDRLEEALHWLLDAPALAPEESVAAFPAQPAGVLTARQA